MHEHLNQLPEKCGLRNIALKYLSLFVFMLLMLNLNATKVALIPTGPELEPVADQVLAAMSNDSGFEFLERANIEAVLKERKLTVAGLTGSNLTDMSKTIHADLFAIITARPSPKGKNEAVVSGLIVYDVHNGFRLINTMLSDQDTVKEITERLHHAQNIIKHLEKQVLLSIVTVRDAGVPEKYKYQMAFITAELDRLLSCIPGVIMLERDYLDNIVQERQLTKQMFELAPSARLLRLEFSPTDSSEKIMLTARVTDVTGKEQIRYRIADTFSSPDDTVKNMIKNLASQLNLTQPPAMDVNLRQSEAARFFEEYRFLLQHDDYDIARSKLQAAIALRPDSPEYRMAMIPLLYELIYRLYAPVLNKKFNFDFDPKFSKAEEALQICDEVSHDFPGYNKGVYREMAGILKRMNSIMWRANDSDWPRMIEFANKVRPKIEIELNPHLSGDIKNIDELENYRKYLLSTCYFHFYFDNKRFSAALLERGVEILRISADFFRRNPKLIPEDIDRQYEIIAGNFGFPSPDYNPKKFLYPDFVINANDYIEAAKKHPLKAANYLGYTLELCRKTVLSNYDEAVFRKDMQEYCHAVDALHMSHIPDRKYNAFMPINYQSFLELTKPGLLKVAEEIASVQLQYATPIEKRLKDITLEKNLDSFAQKVIAIIPQLKQLRPEIFTDPKINNYPGLFANRLYYGIRQKNENCRKALNLLMDGTQITSLLSADKFLIPKNNAEYTGIACATWYNNVIYLLVWSGRDSMAGPGKLSIISFDPKDGIVKNLNHIPLPNNNYGNWARGFAVSENYAQVLNNESVFFVPLDGSAVMEVKDLPGKNIRAATVLGGRSYLFTCRLGQTRSPNETFLISCLPDGSDRKIHISSLREDKQTFLDQNPSWISNAFADAAKKRILFVLGTPENCGLWEFYPESKKLNRLIRGAGISITANKIDNIIYFNSGCAYSFDCQNNQSATIYDNKQSNVCKYPIAYFLMQGNYMCLFTPNLLLVCPSGNMEQSPFIFLPTEKFSSSGPGMALVLPINIFPHPDGSSVIVVVEKNIYKVTIKEKEGSQ